MNSSLTKLNITVMLGGPSAEREVSLRSGAGVVKALRSLGHQVNELDPQNPDWKLPEGTEVVFLALHGTYGEDGTVQQRLEELGMVYTGSDPEASRIGFDKYLTKQRCVAAGIPTARYLLIESLTASWPMGWDPPVVLKPALAEAMRHDSRVLLEEKIAGRECTVGILADEPLPVVEVRPKSPIYDYQTKYSVGSTDYFCPAPFDAAMTARIQAAGLGAFKAIGGRDYSRVDIIVQPNGELVVLEVNTLPGMTEISVLPKAAAVAGLSYPQLCQRMVELALQRKHVVQTQT